MSDHQDTATVLTLPSIALLAPDKGALKAHRQRHPALFEKIVTTPSGQTRYYSQQVSTCIGEYALKILNNAEPWFLIAPLNDNQDTWYALHVDKRVINEQWGTKAALLARFDYELTQCDIIYTSREAEENLTLTVPPEKLTVIDVEFLNAVPVEYQLKQKWQPQKTHYIGAAILCLGLLGSMVYVLKSTEPPKTEITQVDPWQAWRNAYLTQLPADSTLDSAANALSIGALLPHDWRITTLELDNGQLTLSINPTQGQGSYATLTAWNKRFVKGANIGQLEQDPDALFIPVNKRPYATLLTLEDYPKQLHDALLLLGVDSLTLNTALPLGAAKQFKLSGKLTSAPLATLNTLSLLFKDSPVFIERLTVTPNNNVDDLNIEFIFSIIGM